MIIGWLPKEPPSRKDTDRELHAPAESAGTPTILASGL